MSDGAWEQLEWEKVYPLTDLNKLSLQRINAYFQHEYYKLQCRAEELDKKQEALYARRRARFVHHKNKK